MIGFLLAAGADFLITVLVFAVIFILSLVGKFVEKLGQAQKRPPAKPNVPRAGDPLADEIGEFLKRAAERQAPGRARVPQKRPRPAGQPKPRPADVVMAEAVAGPREESVAEHVRDHLAPLPARPISSAELGKGVVEEDKKIEQRLHQEFDHRLGRLTGPTEETARPKTVETAPQIETVQAAPGSMLADLTDLLANPATLRQAIIAAEILNRPAERWR
jgi:hypothetical protein